MAPLIPRLHLWEIDDQPWYVMTFHFTSSLTAWAVLILLARPAPVFIECLYKQMLVSYDSHQLIMSGHFRAGFRAPYAPVSKTASRSSGPFACPGRHPRQLTTPPDS